MGLKIHARKPDSFLHFLMLVDTVMLVFICVSFSYSQDITQRCVCACLSCSAVRASYDDQGLAEM